jgi:hypothetical protein
MGFKDLRAFNEALLAKQGWRIITNPHSLVAIMFKAKYYPKCDFLKAKQSQNMSFSWQSILKASRIQKIGCVLQIGNGNSINIWEDRWINPQVGSIMWSKQLDNTPLQRVADLIDEDTKCWKEHVINPNFFPMEAAQIYSIPLTNTSTEDFISWHGTKDGNYSVKSGYHAIMEWNESDTATSTSSHNDAETRWKKLWSLAVPPKQTHLMWRTLNNALLVKENLLCRGIRCALFCSYCNTKIETINHIFLECDWARQAWFACPLTINMDNMKIKNVSDWIDYMIQTEKIEDMQVISTIMYNIWLARNDREFNGKCLPADDMVRRAMANLHDYQANQNARVGERTSKSGTNRLNKSWSPPPNTFTKLNVDAHSLSEGHWGLGLVLRREDGSCVGAVTRVRKGSNCVLFAEALCLQEAMELVKRWNLKNTIIELDAKAIVDAVHGEKQPQT